MNQVRVMWHGWIALCLFATFVVACGPPPRPEAPKGLKSDVNDNVNGIIIINWLKVEDKDVIGYRLYRSTSNDGKFENVYECKVNLEKQDCDLTKYVDKNVIVGSNYETIYHYKVTSYKIGYGTADFKDRNESEMSEAIQAKSINTSPPNSPTNLKVQASNIDSPQVELTWNAGVDFDLKGYYVYRSEKDEPITLDDKNKVSDLIEVKQGEAPRWVDKTSTGIAPGKKYCYNVVAVDRGDLRSQLIPSIRRCDLLLERLELSAPKDGETSSATPAFKWNELTDSVGYIVALKKSRDFGGEIWRSAFLTTTSTTYNGPKLDTGSTYYWYVYAFTQKPADAAKDQGNSVSGIWSFTVQ